MPYHNLTKEELGIVREILKKKHKERVSFSFFNTDYTEILGKILPKIDDMIHNYDYECPHENTYWIYDQKVCDDCGSMIWD